MWEKINDKPDAENLSGTSRTDEALLLIFEFLKCGIEWPPESLYKAIMLKVRKARLNKDMPFREALKYAIRQKRVKIMKKLAMDALKTESRNGEVESDDDPESEDKAEIGKDSNSYEREGR